MNTALISKYMAKTKILTTRTRTKQRMIANLPMLTSPLSLQIPSHVRDSENSSYDIADG